MSRVALDTYVQSTWPTMVLRHAPPAKVIPSCHSYICRLQFCSVLKGRICHWLLLQVPTWILNEMKLATSPVEVSRQPFEGVVRPPSSLEVTVLPAHSVTVPSSSALPSSPRNFAVTPDAQQSGKLDFKSPLSPMTGNAPELSFSPTPLPSGTVNNSRKSMQVEPIRLPTPKARAGLKSATSTSSLRQEEVVPFGGSRGGPRTNNPLSMKKSRSNVELVPRSAGTSSRLKQLSKNHSQPQVHSQLARVSLSSQGPGVGREAPADAPSSSSSSTSNSPRLLSQQRRASRGSLLDQYPSSGGEGEVSKLITCMYQRVREHSL